MFKPDCAPLACTTLSMFVTSLFIKIFWFYWHTLYSFIVILRYFNINLTYSSY